MSSFQLSGLPFEPFAALFALTDAALLERHARRVVATEKPGYPCRVSLSDAEVGEELLLLPFEHQAAHSPYKASGPIFVRKHAVRTILEPGAIPDYVRSRLISVRAYDAQHMMVDARVCEGRETAAVIEELFANDAVGYIHLHNAKRGCYSCAVHRVNPHLG